MEYPVVLKACPFCGNKAMLSYANGKYGTFGFVKCMICDGQSKTARVIEPGLFEDVIDFWTQSAWESPITAWNNRVTVGNNVQAGGKE